MGLFEKQLALAKPTFGSLTVLDELLILSILSVLKRNNQIRGKSCN